MTTQLYIYTVIMFHSYIPVKSCLRRGLPEKTLSLTSGTSAGDGECLLGVLLDPAAVLNKLAEPLCSECLFNGERLGDAGTN